MSGNDLPDSEETPPVVYSLRIAPRARRDIDEAVTRFVELVSEEVALNWERGLYAVLRSLSINPKRYPRLENSGFPGDVHHLLYRRTNYSIAYRLYYQVQDALKEESPRVTLMHVRHSSARPLNRKEAREIEEQNRTE